MPTQANFSDDLLIDVLNDSVRVVDFYHESASGDTYESLQRIENRILWLHRRSIGIRSDPKSSAATLTALDRLSGSIQRFRQGIDANAKFMIYKTLVGFESVFQIMWEDENSDPAQEDEYRKARIDEFVAEIGETNADEWFSIIQRCAQTESNDLATFPSFGTFLKKLSKAQPEVVLGFIEKLDDKLAGFLGVMLSGLEESNLAEKVPAKISEWLSQDRYLIQIAHYYRFAAKLDNAVLSKILATGIR